MFIVSSFRSHILLHSFDLSFVILFRNEYCVNYLVELLFSSSNKFFGSLDLELPIYFELITDSYFILVNECVALISQHHGYHPCFFLFRVENGFRYTLTYHSIFLFHFFTKFIDFQIKLYTLFIQMYYYLLIK